MGEETAELLANNFKNIDRLLTTPKTKLEVIAGIGPIVAQAVVDWFRDENHRRMLTLLREQIVIKKVVAELTIRPTPATGKTFVLTGSLSAITRAEAKNSIKKSGGKVASAVSNQTDYLIAGADPGSKYNEAERLGVKILSETEFLKLLK